MTNLYGEFVNLLSENRLLKNEIGEYIVSARKNSTKNQRHAIVTTIKSLRLHEVPRASEIFALFNSLRYFYSTGNASKLTDEERTSFELTSKKVYNVLYRNKIRYDGGCQIDTHSHCKFNFFIVYSQLEKIKYVYKCLWNTCIQTRAVIAHHTPQSLVNHVIADVLVQSAKDSIFFYISQEEEENIRRKLNASMPINNLTTRKRNLNEEDKCNINEVLYYLSKRKNFAEKIEILYYNDEADVIKLFHISYDRAINSARVKNIEKKHLRTLQLFVLLNCFTIKNSQYSTNKELERVVTKLKELSYVPNINDDDKENNNFIL